MRVRVDTNDDTLAVYRRLDDLTTRLHKYAVVQDRRRTSAGWGTYADATDLSRLTVRFERRTEYLDGRLIGTRYSPDSKVTDHLRNLGVTILDAVDADADAEVIV
jgi:hypothetical protein